MSHRIALLSMIICVLAGQAPALQWSRESAENALNQARELRDQLTNAQSLNKSELLRCIRLYKRVWYSDPHYGGCDDAVYEAAVLYQEMGAKFGVQEYSQEAADLLHYLVKEYDTSPFRRDARARLAVLESHASEPAQPRVKAQDAPRQPTAGKTDAQPVAAVQGNAPPQPAAAHENPGASSMQSGRLAAVQSIRHWSASDRTRVTIDLDGPVRYQAVKISNPDRMYFDLSGAELSRDISGKAIAVGDTLLKQIRTGQNKRDVARIVLDFTRASDVSVSQLSDPCRIVIDIRNAVASSGAVASGGATAPPVALPTAPTPSGSIRAAGKETASRTDSPVTAKAPPQVPPGPKPGEKAVIETASVTSPQSGASDTAAPQKTMSVQSPQKSESAGLKPGERVPLQIVPAARPAEVSSVTAAARGTSPAPPAGPPVPAQQPEVKVTAPARQDSAVAERSQPPAPATPKLVETPGSTRSAAPAASAQARDSAPANRSLPEPPDLQGRAKSSASNGNGSMASLPSPPLAEPAPASLRTGTDLPISSVEPPLAKVATDNGLVVKTQPNPAVRSRDIPPPAKSATPTSKGDMTLTRVLGLKVGRIVIDPGHGGHDTGTVGRNGLMEKDLVLDVALSLKKSLEERLGAQVVMTRNDDRFISLEERTALANRLKADLFISIHANASTSRSTSGVETYFLNFAQSASDREIAARENATTFLNIGELQDLIRKIAMADKSTESRELAATMQRSLYTGSRVIFPKARNRGVRSAPFIVLIGAEMPAVLVEVAFISNPRDEKLLKKENNHQVLARALMTGIEGYLKSLASYMADNHPGSN